MEKIEKFIKNESLLLIKEFKSNISTYLNGYVAEIQSLYDSLNNYVNTKLNTHEELNSLITQYNLILNNMSEIADKDINLEKEQVELFLQEINNKTKDIENEFFENYYLKNFSSYLEYPDEVLYKIINFGDELKLISEIVKKQIDYLVNRKIWRVREENHNYIRKKKDFFSRLIKLKMNNFQIFDYYKEFRVKNNLEQILGEYNFVNDYSNDNIFDDFYVNNINNTYKEYKNVLTKIEEKINEDWILKNCTEVEMENITDNSPSDIDDFILTNNTDKIKLNCYEYKIKSSLNYSEYNYNVVKLRRGIYYIKYLYENLKNLFNQFNIDILANVSQIIQKDEIINDKNILNLYDKSKEKLNEYNKESNVLLEEFYEYYQEDIKKMIINEPDFANNYNKFKNILNFQAENFILYVNKQINNINSELFELFNKYNNTLADEIKITKEYEKYNFNYTNFRQLIKSYLNEIEIKFNNIINSVKNIPNDYIFNNALRTKMKSLYDQKSNNFKNIVKELNRLYHIKPFNLTFDINQLTENIINKFLENVMFKFIYDYMEIYESNKNKYVKSVLQLIEINKKEIINKFKNINEDFLKELNNYSVKYINKEYLIKYTNNYTLCLNYSFNELNETLKKDKENFNKYIIYNNRLEMCQKIDKNKFNINYLDKIKLNITNSSIIEILDKIKEDTEEQNSDYLTIINEYVNNLCKETLNNKVNFKNETEIHLDCVANNYYENYLNLTYFDTFNQEIKNNLSELSIKIKEEINSFNLGGKFIENYLLSSDYIKLEEYEIF